MNIMANQMDYKTLNDMVRTSSDNDITISHCLGQRYIAAGLSGKNIEIYGTPGNAMGSYLCDGTIHLHGNAQEATGDTMNGGTIYVHGSVGDGTGYAMRGGRIYIQNDAGYRTGIHMGFGKVENRMWQIDNLKGDFQVLCVCGFNEQLKKTLESKRFKKDVRCYGFAKNVDVMMDASDCIITKPGGLTISESLAKGIIPVLIDPIPGQEDRNAEFLVNNGIAVKTSPSFPIDEAIFQLFHDKERISSMEQRVRAFGKPNAAHDLCEFIVEKYGK